MKKKIISLLVLLMAAVTGAWAQQKYNVTFSGLDNTACNTTFTDVTLPYSKSFGKTDACSNAYDIDGSSNNEQLVGASFGGDNFTITVKSAFEGTITVSVSGWTESFDPYSRNITVACVPAAPPFDYTFSVADCDHGTGTVKFFIDEKEVKGAYQADEGKTVTVTVTPDDGWIVDVENVTTALPYGKWGVRRVQAAPNIAMQSILDLTYVSTDDKGVATFTFQMPASNVKVNAEYLKISTLYFDPAEKTNLMTITTKVGDAAATTATPDEEGKLTKVLEGTEINLTANTGYKFRKVEVKKTMKLLTLTIGDVTIYYAEGDSWANAISRDENKDSGLFIREGNRVHHSNDGQLVDSNTEAVLPVAKINANESYRFIK